MICIYYNRNHKEKIKDIIIKLPDKELHLVFNVNNCLFANEYLGICVISLVCGETSIKSYVRVVLG